MTFVNRDLTRIGLNRDLVTATAAIAALGSFLFGFLTNLPVALAWVSTSSSMVY
jgi:xanthine/uracil/vitamin C permease (AzgA family)